MRVRYQAAPHPEGIFDKSGWQDSNLRPPAPKAGAITGLRYTPKRCANIHQALFIYKGYVYEFNTLQSSFLGSDSFTRVCQKLMRDILDDIYAHSF